MTVSSEVSDRQWHSRSHRRVERLNIWFPDVMVSYQIDNKKIIIFSYIRRVNVIIKVIFIVLYFTLIMEKCHEFIPRIPIFPYAHTLQNTFRRSDYSTNESPTMSDDIPTQHDYVLRNTTVHQLVRNFLSHLDN